MPETKTEEIVKSLYKFFIVDTLKYLGIKHRCEDNVVQVPFDENYVGIDEVCSVCGEPI